ncbi:hypothetical protein BTR22_11650 [Alkalihalophilus pseudofirmus]|uniref:GNAT family N-acetyltransferase n=1 Tax=Alkalihalophilus pseudofirmus TaxID=79885 RepID=UPI00095256B1|nr:hypothetical protein BTR22_11650 [Alkalihalophilus pseudofirmus]
MIRQAEVRDAKEIQSIAEITWKHTYKRLYSMDVIENFLQKAYEIERLKKSIQICSERNDCGFIVAEDEGQCIGFAQAVPYLDGLELSRIYILPDSQRKGLGQLLVNKIIDIAKAAHKPHLYVYVEKENEDARAFYEREGFHTIDEIEDSALGVKSTLVKCQKQVS